MEGQQGTPVEMPFVLGVGREGGVSFVSFGELWWMDSYVGGDL